MYRPLVLIHGYSASGTSFDAWVDILKQRGYDEQGLHVCTYRTLTNEVDIKDIAEALDRALRIQTGLTEDEEFDAIVHSTGMLVLRAWLASHEKRRGRLKHLIGLAPATFGSPLAHKGRGWLGSVFRGNREKGPDFREAGDRVLDGLELGSAFTWELAHRDLIGDEPFYGWDADSPYAFVFCGISKYPFPLSIISEDGTDGTVRIAGAALNTRKIKIDLTVDRAAPVASGRVLTEAARNPDLPVIPIPDRDHGSIMNNPPDVLVDLVVQALAVDDEGSFREWLKDAERHSSEVLKREKAKGEKKGLHRWQQFVVRVTDERGDGVPDYYLDFIVKRAGDRKWRQLRDYKMSVHPYSTDMSYRCFHVDLDSFELNEGDTLGIRLVASSGTALVTYNGFTEDAVKVYVDEEPREVQGEWTGIINLSTLPEINFFYPFTTTLVEIKLNREPQPLKGRNDLLWFPATAEGRQAAAADALRAADLTAEEQERLEALYAGFVARQQQ